jgi:hypothetical protein
MHQNIFSSVLLLICVISNVSSYFLTQDSLTCSSQAEKLSHTTANSILSSKSIKLSSFGDCSDPKNSYCTSLEKINCITICALIKYKTVSSSCNVTITGMFFFMSFFLTTCKKFYFFTFNKRRD